VRFLLGFKQSWHARCLGATCLLFDCMMPYVMIRNYGTYIVCHARAQQYRNYIFELHRSFTTIRLRFRHCCWLPWCPFCTLLTIAIFTGRYNRASLIILMDIWSRTSRKSHRGLRATVIYAGQRRRIFPLCIEFGLAMIIKTMGQSWAESRTVFCVMRCNEVDCTFLPWKWTLSRTA